MAKVTLAYPIDIGGVTHKPDATVEVDDVLAAQLVREGNARPANKTSEAAVQPAKPVNEKGA